MKRIVLKQNIIKGLFLLLTVVLVLLIAFSDTINAMEDVSISNASKISTELSTKMSRASKDKLTVMAWFDDIDMNAVKQIAVQSLSTASADCSALANASVNDDVLKEMSLEQMQTYIMKKRSLAQQAYTKANTEKAYRNFDEKDIVYISKFSPVVLVELTADEIYSKANKSDIAYLGLLGNNDTADCEIANKVTQAEYVQLFPNFGQDGTGINIGILDIGLPDATEFTSLVRPSQNLCKPLKCGKIGNTLWRF